MYNYMYIHIYIYTYIYICTLIYFVGCNLYVYTIEIPNTRPTCVKTEDISQICKQHALVCSCFEKIVPGSRISKLGHVWTLEDCHHFHGHRRVCSKARYTGKMPGAL